MISHQYRFHGRASIGRVYRSGQTARGEYVSIKYAPSKREDYRLAVVVSKKVSKSAVVRNRIRRRIYEIVRKAKSETDQKWPVDILISVFDERVATMPIENLEDTIHKLLGKAGVTIRSR